MKKLFILFIFFFNYTIYSQSRGEIIDYMITSGLKEMKGKEFDGLILTNAINENNTTLVYILNPINKESADFYKNNQTKTSFINQSPNALSRRAVKSEIIVKWRYYYNNEKILEISVHPKEWNE